MVDLLVNKPPASFSIFVIQWVCFYFIFHEIPKIYVFYQDVFESHVLIESVSNVDLHHIPLNRNGLQWNGQSLWFERRASTLLLLLREDCHL